MASLIEVTEHGVAGIVCDRCKKTILKDDLREFDILNVNGCPISPWGDIMFAKIEPYQHCTYYLLASFA